MVRSALIIVNGHNLMYHQVGDVPDSQLISNNTSGHFIQIDEPGWLAHTITQFIKRQSK